MFLISSGSGLLAKSDVEHVSALDLMDVARPSAVGAARLDDSPWYRSARLAA
jgi:hypothetical protein